MTRLRQDGFACGRSGSLGDSNAMTAAALATIPIIRTASWREVVSDVLRGHDGPVAVSDLYRAVADHPKTKTNPNWQAKLRQTLQRGAGRSVGRDQWVAA